MPVTHVTPVGGNVFADLGFARDEAETLNICSTLMISIRGIIENRELSVRTHRSCSVSRRRGSECCSADASASSRPTRS